MKTPEEIEKLSNAALNSLDHLQPAEANPFLFGKIKHKLIQQRQEAAATHIRLMFRLSAVLLLFIGINAGSFYAINKWQDAKPKTAKPGKTKTGVEAVSEEYFPTTNAYSY